MAASVKRSLLAIFASVLSVFLVNWLIDIDLTKPALAQRTDFCNCFYVAGTIIRTGQLHDLYPELSANTEVNCQFSTIAHSLLPYLPAASRPCWQYIPLDAVFLAPFTYFSPSIALLIWQTLSVFALAPITFVISRASKIPWSTCASLAVLLLPIFQTLKMGQQGIILGLLPIFLALHLLQQKKPFFAGLCLALTLLTLKFFVVSGLIAVAIWKMERRVIFGLATGSALLMLLMFSLTPMPVIAQWIHNLPLSEKWFFEQHFVHNLSLYVSVPMMLILHFPLEYREFAKGLFYALSVGLALCSLFTQWRIANSSIPPDQKLPMIIAASFYSMPAMLPHLLYYDLAGMALSGLLLWNLTLPQLQLQKLRAIAITSAIVIDACFINMALLETKLFHPLMFVLVLLVLFAQLIMTLLEIAKTNKETSLLNFAPTAQSTCASIHQSS